MVLHRRHLPSSVLLLGLLGCGLGGCSVSPADVVGAGGSTGTGGTTASGGSGSGGSGKGGSEASGGSMASGGTKGSGGVADKGGTVGAGGSNAGGTQASGGSVATGGSSAGAPGTGGAAKGTGGAATGGSSTAGPGTGGLGRGGAGTGMGGAGGLGTGGSTRGGGGSTSAGSPGCGSTSPLKTGNFTETINGTARKWMLDVPTGYNANKPYRLIFVWHPLSGNGSQIVSGGFNGLKSLANNTAVFATADGLNGSNGEASGTGWWNANGGDMKLFQAMLDKINAGLCIDQERIFSTGFSFGGMMSYTLPFEFDVFRAVAPCSGKTGVIPFEEKFSGPVPIMAFHGNNDTFVATSLGKAFLDKYRTRNKCGTQTKAVSPSPCVQYEGCVETTIWCEFSGAHNTWSEEPAAIWKFFSQY